MAKKTTIIFMAVVMLISIIAVPVSAETKEKVGECKVEYCGKSFFGGYKIKWHADNAVYYDLSSYRGKLYYMSRCVAKQTKKESAVLYPKFKGAQSVTYEVYGMNRGGPGKKGKIKIYRDGDTKEWN